MVARHPLQVARALAGMPRLAMRARRARRAPGLEFHDGTNAFVMRSLGAAVADGIARAAERFGATRNDVLMAALIRALAGLKPPPAKGARRYEVAVASIVNIRSRLRRAGVAHVRPVPVVVPRRRIPIRRTRRLEDVVRAVHAESRDLRTRRRYLRSLIAIALSGIAWRVVRDERRDTIYAKHYPVWSGLTTLVVPGLWNALVPVGGARARRVPARRVDRSARADRRRRDVQRPRARARCILSARRGPAADVHAVVDRYVASLEALS